MKTIKLNKIHLENYKAIPNIDIDFSDRTEISGKNAVGKTTVMDSFFDVMTGKMSDGNAPDSIRPHDKSGTDINKVDIVRHLDLDIDGTAASIRKVTAQKWRRPRGTTDEVFDGNETRYEVDGFAYSPTQFAQYMEKIAPADIMLLCSNAKPFLATLRKSTADARKVLERLSGFDVTSFAMQNPEYAKALSLIGSHTVEDVLKKLRKNLKDQTKLLEIKDTEIKYEMNRTVSEPIEISEMELLRADLKKKIDSVNCEMLNIKNSLKYFSDIYMKISLLKQEQEQLILAKKRKKFDLQEKISDLTIKHNSAEQELHQLENELFKTDIAIDKCKANIADYQKQWTDAASMEYTSKVDDIRSEVMDPSNNICSVCGQEFPESLKADILAAFEADKQRRIDEDNSFKASFYADKEEKLKRITNLGNKTNELLSEKLAYKDDLNIKISKQIELIKQLTDDVEEKSNEISELPAEVDMSNNVQYMQCEQEITALQEELDKTQNPSETILELETKREYFHSKFSDVDSKIKKHLLDSEEQDKRIEKLEAEHADIVQKQAEIESEIDIVDEFSRAKNQALSEAINKHFKHLQFVFLDKTQEGNYFETCKIMVNGTDYLRGLNHGDRILAEVDLVAGFQSMNELSIPIWIDDTESLDASRVPRVIQQLIMLRRTDDEKLSVNAVI